MSFTRMLEQRWVTPKHNKPNHPHVLSWAIFLSEGFRGISEQFRANSLQPIVLKCRMGVRESIPGTTPGRSNSPNFHIRPTGVNLTGFKCPGNNSIGIVEAPLFREPCLVKLAAANLGHFVILEESLCWPPTTELVSQQMV